MSTFVWLYGVATCEAYRLCEAERRYTHLQQVLPARSCEALIADASCIDDILEAREALDILASLPDREREDLTLVVAGFSYDEIGEMTGGRTFSAVRRQVDKARGRVRLARLQGTVFDPRASSDSRQAAEDDQAPRAHRHG
jgi:DNA-directed RNA polymerase specialized sigma24 family protein